MTEQFDPEVNSRVMETFYHRWTGFEAAKRSFVSAKRSFLIDDITVEVKGLKQATRRRPREFFSDFAFPMTTQRELEQVRVALSDSRTGSRLDVARRIAVIQREIRKALLEQLAPQRFTEAFKELVEISKLGEGWDGEGAASIGPWPIAIMATLLHRLSCSHQTLSGLVPTNIEPTAPGGLYVDWDRPEVRYELYVFPEERMRLLRIRKEGGRGVEWTPVEIQDVDSVADMLVQSDGQELHGG